MVTNEICLLNDSFPPEIDGVANAVTNYARVISKSGGNVCVVTPEYPEADDSAFDYPVIRYPSLNVVEKIGYTAGIPFDVNTLLRLNQRKIGLLHSHCPVMSSMIARTLRESMNVPFVMTYHTKFDVDIANAIRLKGARAGAIKALVDSVSACDELWVVSNGAGKNIRSLGYCGDYIVMENGVDLPRRRLPEDIVLSATKEYDLPQNIPVFLFVGRMMWYKGIRIILDALAALKSQGFDFRMMFVGGGGDEQEIRSYATALKLDGKVFFTGPLNDRDRLTAWYCRADLLLFPSTFDTNGLVVREAAACSLGSVLVSGSCAAEGVTNGNNALLIDENAASLAVCLAKIMEKPEIMHRIGENAARDLYISWDDAVQKAIDRYQLVMDRYRSGVYPKHKKLTDDLFVVSGELIDIFAAAEEHRKTLEERIERWL